MMLALMPAMLFITWVTEVASIDASHYWRGVAVLPILYAAFGICMAVVAVPLKWLILFRDAEDQPGQDGWPWYPYFRLRYYRHLLAQWTHMLALASFMSLLQ